MQALSQLRIVAYIEGLSFLLLLFVAMPLKYLAGMPLAVRVVGMAHGLLFVAFVITLARAASEHDWPLRRTTLCFLSSIVPFGTFAFDGTLRREIALEAEARAPQG